ncbi:MAG TPA: hypothetical protein VMP11_09760 [Verrucomicrobiae bacterium]|nr:hypothetical protein [Verrucomicrobiae bacterium]
MDDQGENVTVGQHEVLRERQSPPRTVRACVSALCVLIALWGICEADARAQSVQPFPNYPDLARAIAVQTANQPALLATEGVRGVGVGVSGGNLSLVVLVDNTNTAAGLPSSLDGFPVNAVTVGTIHPLTCAGANPQLTYPLPIPLGVSGGNDLPVDGGCASGTVGFKVRDNATGQIGWISNSHVVANGTDGCPGGAPLGTPEYQPGPVDLNCAAGQFVGSLNRFVPIDFTGGNNMVDAGFVRSSDAAVSGIILNLGPQVNNVVPAFVGQSVQKDGRTTACTEGVVTAINMSFPLAYDCGETAIFTGQIQVNPVGSSAFAAAGDSGSPVVDVENNAVGLLFAGDPTTGIAFVNPIGAVLSALNVSLASSGSSQVVTRTSRYWFTHGYNLTETNCATLLSAIQANGSVMNLGFANLPTANRNADNVIDAYDTLIETLSFYWRSSGVTGEPNGTQSDKLKASSLCTIRKKLAVELIAATANTALFGTFPGDATYSTGKVTTNFPGDLISQAQSVAAGYDPVAIRNMTALLMKFNSSGVTNNLPNGLAECSAQPTKMLKPIARDPMIQSTCPGQNGTCASAKAIVFLGPTPTFHDSESIVPFQATMPAPTCNSGGRNAVWQVSPPVAANGRQFNVSTAGSNFDTVLSVWSGTCGVSSNSSGIVSNSLIQVACADNALGVGGESLTFTTDGTNNFYIVVEGKNGAYGLAKLSVLSF